jgi:tryptophan-rich sensory protein
MSTLTQSWRRPRNIVLLAVFLVVVIGIGTLIGTTTAPGGWYAGLEKPPFNPPNWLFAPVWFTLYVLIAVAGWRTFIREPRSPAMKLWFAQMGLNWLWSPVFFSLHWLWPAFAVIVALLACILSFIWVSWRQDRAAAWMFVPYAAWVGFASILNFSVAILN